MNSRSHNPSDLIWETADGDEALRRYRDLATMVDGGIFQLSPSGKFVSVSDALVDMTGYSREAVLGESVSMLFSESDTTDFEREIRVLKESAEPFATLDVFVQSADGHVAPCEMRLKVLMKDGEFGGSIGLVRERSGWTHGSDSDLPQPPENVLGTLLERIDGGIFVLNSAFEIVWADETVGTYFGFDPQELVGRDKREMVETVLKDRVEDPERFAERVLSGYDTNRSVEQFSCEVTAGDTRDHRWLEHWSKPIEAGQFAGGRIEIYTEITDRKEATAALQETEERFYSLVDAVEEYAIIRLDTDGRVVSWNEGAENIKGYEKGEILGDHFSRFYTEAERAVGAPEQNLMDAAENGSAEDEGWRVRKDGSRFWANVTITALRDDDGTHQGYLKVTRDMTDRHQREQELESELYEILSRISDAFYALDVDWRFTHVNERAEDLLQHSREELLGECLWEMFPEAADTKVWEQFQEAMETQEPANFELEYEALDIWVEATAYPSESGLSVYFLDITDRIEKQRQIRQRERQLTEYKKYTDKILDTIDDLFYVVDQDDSLQRWNESLSNLTGYTDDEIASMAPVDFFVEEDRETVTNGIQSVFETGSTRFEATMLAKGGQQIPIEFAASAVETPDGERVLAGIGRDITARIERERALEESNERLEQFAYAASHDLQEPLRMVSSYLRLIEQRYGDGFDEDGREFLEFAVDGADRMRDMIDGLLAYSRIESKGAPFEPVELSEAYADACDNLRVAITEHGGEITCDQLPRVEGDASQLRQLFQNLLDNAITYSGEDPARIHVSADRGERPPTSDRDRAVTTTDTDQWIISVRDNGIGIDPDDQDRIFQVFQSLDGPDENGSGIGLALCKRIVERHGGDIWVDSEAGEGTTISFTLDPAGETDD